MGLEEIWKPIFGYEDRYEVSNFGKIKSLRTKQILQGESTKDGYVRVRLWDGEHYKSRMIHCLVAEAFIPLPDTNNQYEVDHIDNNVTNNVVTNLQWLTHAENLSKSAPPASYDAEEARDIRSIFLRQLVIERR